MNGPTNAPEDAAVRGDSPLPPQSPPSNPAAPVPTGPTKPANPRRRLLAWIGWAGFLLCGVMLLSQWSARRDYYDVTRGLRERFHSGVVAGDQKVAIITVRGVIMEGDGFVKRQIERVREDERIKAVVVRVESPGGTVTGSDFIHHHLSKLRAERGIPLVVSMGSIAASGGYYVAMSVGEQPKSIFAEPTTTTGSIGVIVPHYDLTGLLARFDVKEDSIASHPRKQMLSMTREMSPEDREIIQAYVNESFERFKTIVKSGRPELRKTSQLDKLLDREAGRDLATGEIFTATKAKQYGLVDEIGFIEDAIARAVELAGLDAQRVRVVEYDPPASLMGLIGLEMTETGGSLAAILELSVPRAFYLASSLPPLASSRRQ
ncbi:MAG: signal peptide peptidase SppA [Planctomycetes bacterium]|nr:signal peptide peptidase SppA [Planctomycetota bacterium]